MIRLRFSAFGVALLSTLATAGAADLAQDRSPAEEIGRSSVRVRSVVDYQFVKTDRCRRDPDCIAPRVLPIPPDGRRVDYVGISIPVDPRFEDRYRR